VLGKKSNKSNSKKKKGGLLRAIGVNAEAAPTDEAVSKRERQSKIELAWVFLRDRIDKASHEYYRSGSFKQLEQFVEKPALDLMKEQLTKLREDNVYWHQPDRQAQTEPRYNVISEQLNKNNQPTSFVIEERFSDHSALYEIAGEELLPLSTNEGQERVIRATVNVRGGSEFLLHSVLEVRSQMLENE
jgi:hypothetical protein